jgi:3',5'-cyclic AMP phosphodiesterase CpdA
VTFARLGLLTALLLALPAASAGAQTTVQRTIQDCNADNLLEYAPGEPHVLFGAPAGEEGCEPSPAAKTGRHDDAAVLLNFLQLTDFQMVDEESPGRVEFVDGTQRAPGLQPFSAAYRPQEALTTQVTEAMVRQVRGASSPVTGTKPSLSILTGDNADSQQFNETRWFIDILDGNRRVDPDSGVPTAACAATPGTRYDGVRDSGVNGAPDDGYYEPDGEVDGDGYSPDRARNAQETTRDVTVRDFKGLFERANEPFDSRGLGMPWYSAFGNHDALVQGNSPQAYAGPFGAPATETYDPVFHALVTGCTKVKQPSEATIAEITELYEQIGQTPTPEQVALVLERANQVLLQGDGGVQVPPDARRCYLAKDDNLDGAGLAPGPCSTGSWIHQHFRTGGTPSGHGFAPADPAQCAKYGGEAATCRDAARRLGADPTLGRPDSAVLAHDGYYSFVPRKGFRFVVLDTVTDECGTIFCSEGSVDDTQFQWLGAQIAAAEAQGQKVLIFSHHTLRTIRFPTVDPTEQPQHNGERVDRRGGQPLPPSPVQTLEELYCEHPAVIAHIAGHEHENYVERHGCAADTPPTPGTNPVFWHVSTAAHIDWPQQSRMSEIVRARGQMALVLTMLDHSGQPNPGTAPADRSVPRLASIARELSYNDYQGARGARGTRQDRNVVLPLGAR